jgi:hypothetical protein
MPGISHHHTSSSNGDSGDEAGTRGDRNNGEIWVSGGSVWISVHHAWLTSPPTPDPDTISVAATII